MSIRYYRLNTNYPRTGLRRVYRDKHKRLFAPFALGKIYNNIGTGGISSSGTTSNSVTSLITIYDTFNSGSGNWTVPAGVTSVQIELWGAGGGGGQGDDVGGSVGATGGGAGAYCKKNALSVTPGDIISYVVGAGGAGNTDVGVGCAAGTTGGTTTVAGGTYTAGGGVGGDSCGDAGNKAGGTASGGDVNTSGGNGAAQSAQNGTYGGDSPSGGTGGATVASDVNGNPGNAPGGGGSGGGKRAYGGAGANGRVVFTYSENGDPPSGNTSSMFMMFM